MRVLTEQQAYAAAYHFLEKYWELTRSMDVGDLVSYMSLSNEGEPADAAMSERWREAVDFALQGGSAGNLVLKK